MTFPFPIMLNGRAWGNSIWTDFTDKWNGETYLGAYSAGAFMPDWALVGTATFSSVVSESGSISGQAYQHTAEATTGVVHFLTWGEPSTSLYCDVLMGGKVTVNAPAPTDGFGPFVRRNTDGRMHAILSGSDVSPRSNVSLASINLTNIYDTSVSFGWDWGVWYWVRANVDSGGTLRVKAWERGTPEPASWSITWSPAIPPSSGTTGIILGAGTLSQQFIDFFSVCTDGAPAWGPV